MVIDPKGIGNRIKSERMKLQYTQEQFSEILSIGRVHLSNIESGRSMASLDLIVEISRITNCSLDYLICNTTPKPLSPKEQLRVIISLLQAVMQAFDDVGFDK